MYLVRKAEVPLFCFVFVLFEECPGIFSASSIFSIELFDLLWFCAILLVSGWTTPVGSTGGG